ncbi:MAG: PH domain-containing protein [Vicingaceae bacterium]
MPDFDLSQPQRQSVVGVGVIFFQKVRKAFNLILSILVLQFGVKADLTSFWFGGAIGLVFIGLLVVAILTYRNFYFYALGDAFIIEKGVFSREKVNVPFERIQTVNINQNIIQRILGVVGLKIDTAGSSGQELEIAALPKSVARHIQSFLMEHKEAVLDEGTENTKESSPSKGERRALMELNLMDLVKIGLTENHLKTAGILFAIINGYFWQFQDYFAEYTEEIFNDKAGWLSYWTMMLPLIIIATFIGIALFSVVQSILRFYDLRFYCDQEGVKLESGLLKRAEYQIPENKIQLIKWSTNPLRKLVGYKTVVVKQASSVQLNDKLSVMIPACREEQLERILSNFFPEKKQSEFQDYPAQTWFQFQLILIFAIIPALFFCFLGYFESPFYLVALIWFGLASILSYQYAKSMTLKSNQEVIQLHRGWMFPQCIYLNYYKLQNIQFKQNVFQKRRSLAHLVLHTAAGSHKMWQMDEKQAMEIYNYALYKIESAEKSWM